MKISKITSAAPLLCAAALCLYAGLLPASAAAQAPVVSPVTGEAKCAPARPVGVSGPRRNYTAWGAGFRAVVSGDTLELEGDGVKEGCFRVKRVKVKNGMDFRCRIDGRQVTLSLRRQNCRDSQGRRYEISSRLHYGGMIFRGCALPGAYGIADT